MTQEIYIAFDDRHHFLRCLNENPGIIIVKFGAKWCNPCKQIANLVEQKFQECNSNILCCDLDVDDNIDLYAFFKKSRQINGIPVILAFYKNNISHIPDLRVSGINIDDIHKFFKECIKVSNTINKTTIINKK